MTNKRSSDLEEALTRVLNRMGDKNETLEEAVEAVYPDYEGDDFRDTLIGYAQGRTMVKTYLPKASEISFVIQTARRDDVTRGDCAQAIIDIGHSIETLGDARRAARAADAIAAARAKEAK